MVFRGVNIQTNRRSSNSKSKKSRIGRKKRQIFESRKIGYVISYLAVCFIIRSNLKRLHVLLIKGITQRRLSCEGIMNNHFNSN